MQSQNDQKRLKEFFRSPFVLAFFILIIILIIILGFFSVKKIFSPNEGIYEEYDPASETEVYFAPSTNGTESEKTVRYVGLFDILMKNKVTPEQYVSFKEAMVGYAKENGVDLSRVSYIDDSLYVKEPCIYKFGVALNVDESLANVTIDASNDCTGTTGLRIVVDKE